MASLFSLFQGDSPLLQFIGKWGYRIYSNREMFQMQIHLMLAALFPIYIGSHASLRCPPSAKAPEKKKQYGDDGDDEIDVDPEVAGLTPSDAVMFPVLAGITLAGLYFVIKWLDDPAILNKILTWYFSCLGVFGVGKLAGDGLNVATTFIFPSVWSDGKKTYYIDPELSSQVTGSVDKTALRNRKIAGGKKTPFPGLLSAINIPDVVTKNIWSFRALLKNHWIFRGYIHGIFSLKSRVQFNDVVGLIIGVGAVTLYSTSGKAWWLTNLMGFGFCYGTLQLLSTTTFWTGSLVLGGLFIYDIVMVFYTPLMVTVATTLDVPIKLVFPGPKHGGMLGLGDVVLPGIIMALALRFDLYLYYLRKQQTASSSNIPSNLDIAATPSTTSTSSTAEKPTYIPATSLWGERFWTSKSEATLADTARFPKPYFYASIGGYITGMGVTLIILNIFQHAQPALLYLVPGVLGSLWGTALARGELKEMWEYTEDSGAETDAEKEKEKDKKDGDKSDVVKAGEKVSEGKEKEKVKEKENEHAHHVFLFSLSEPKYSSKRPLKTLGKGHIGKSRANIEVKEGNIDIGERVLRREDMELSDWSDSDEMGDEDENEHEVGRAVENVGGDET